MSITAILTAYRRTHALALQVDAIKAQTVPPDHIWIVVNGLDVGPLDIPDGCEVIHFSWNTRYHGRFAVANLVQTDYVAIFDDDTIPGPRWFENCLSTEKPGELAIFGTSGVVLNGCGYKNNTRIGWNGHQYDEPRVVDLVGHAWFFHRNVLCAMWSQPPATQETGEDIQLSAFAAAYGIKTIVPPHPVESTDMWGSQPEFGIPLGTDSAASSSSNKMQSVRDNLCRGLVGGGWDTVNMQSSDFRKHLNRFVKMLSDGEPFALSRYGDGEYSIMCGREVKCSEFHWSSANEWFRRALTESFTYEADNYYVGVSCPCCRGGDSNDMVELSGQHIDRLTWANIFVNSNHRAWVPFVKQFGPVSLVCNEAASPSIQVEHMMSVPINAMNTGSVLPYARDLAVKATRPVFVAAGPMGSVVVAEMHRANPGGTYVDVGSSLDRLLGLGSTRGYHRGADTINKVCVGPWG